MAIQRPNLNKHIAAQPKFKIGPSNGKPGAEGDIMSMIMPIAQKYVEKMDTKYKLAIIGIVYLVLAGAWQTIMWTVKLINFIF